MGLGLAPRKKASAAGGGAPFSPPVQTENLASTYTTMSAFGDSITVGSNADPVTLGWAYLFAAAKSATLTNKGIGGTWWSNQPSLVTTPLPTTDNGRDRFQADLLGANKKEFVAINYGYNEARYVANPTVANVTNFINDARETLIGLRLGGFEANKILLGNLYTVSDARLANSGQTRSGYETYVTAKRNLALEFGVFFADVYGYMNSHGGDSLIDPGDTIHPINAGHAVIKDANMLATRTFTGAMGELELSSPSSTSLKVDFAAITGATSYDVGIALVGSLTFPITAAPTTNTVTFTSLGSGDYVACARAVFPNGFKGPWQFQKIPQNVGTAFFIADSFNGIADETVITSVSGWIRQPVLAAPSSDVVITKGRARSTSANASVYQRTETPPSANYEVTVYVDVRSKGTTVQAGPAGRMSGAADTYYYARYTQGASPTFSLYKRVNGAAAVQLGSNYNATLEHGQFAKLTLSMNVSTIKMLVNDVERVSVTDTAITAAGKAGMRLAGVSGADTDVQIDKIFAKAL